MTNRKNILARASRAQKASHKVLLHMPASELGSVKDGPPVERLK